MASARWQLYTMFAVLTTMLLNSEMVSSTPVRRNVEETTHMRAKRQNGEQRLLNEHIWSSNNVVPDYEKLDLE